MTRKRRGAVAAVAVLALAAVFGWYAVTWSRASLEQGSAAGPVSGLTGSTAGWQVRVGAPEFVFAQSIRNSSRVDVTITGITTNPGDPFDISAGYVPAQPGIAGVEPNSVGRSFPVRLGHGEELYVLLRFRQRSCLTVAAGSSMSFESMQVRYRLYGVGRTAHIPFSSPVTASADALRRHPVCA